jgi:hypothetical protein
MMQVRRNTKQKVVGAAAVAALLAAGSIAAVTATGHSAVPKKSHAHRRAHHGATRQLAVAASYLGVSPAQLSSELSAHKTLAQIADSTSGRSAAGLSAALVAARKARLASVAAKLPQRVAAQVNRVGGPLGAAAHGKSARQRGVAALFAKPTRLGAVAAGYLQVAPKQLLADLRAGKTLAQVADATPGKSQAGLVSALAAARRAKLERASAAGRVPAARKAKRLARLDKHIGALVQRQFAGAGSP